MILGGWFPWKDVQFHDLTRSYDFAIGVFDNTPIDGSFSQVYQLTFAPSP